MSSLSRGRKVSGGGQGRKGTKPSRGGRQVSRSGTDGTIPSRDTTSVRLHQPQPYVDMNKNAPEKKKLHQAQISTDEEWFVSSRHAIASGSKSLLDDLIADNVTDPIVKYKNTGSREPRENEDEINPVVRHRSPRSVGEGKKDDGRSGSVEKVQSDARETISTVRKNGRPVSRKRSLSSAVIGNEESNKKTKKSSANEVGRRVTESESSNDEGGVSEGQKENNTLTMNANSNGGDNCSLATIGRREAIAIHVDIKTLISTVLNNNTEIRELKKMIEDLKQVVHNNTASRCDRKIVNDGFGGAKKQQFEEFMLSRVNMLDVVFGPSEILRSTVDVLVVTIVKDRKDDEILVWKVKELFEVFGYASKKNSKEGIDKTVVGRKVSVFRRSILLECIRKAYERFDDAIARTEEDYGRPLWISMVSRGDAQQKPVMYIGEREMGPGYSRRERKTEDLEGLSRCIKIADGKCIVTFEDDGEFVGWWSYGALMGMFTRTRKAATASLFEAIIYLFVPWFCSVGDRDVIQVDDDAEIPSLKDKEVEEVLKRISRKSLAMEWAAGRHNEIKDLTTIPLAITEQEVSVESANASNQGIYRKFSEERTELQMHTIHDVAVYKPLKGSGKRQRKGSVVRTLTRTITLLDAAAQYLYQLSVGDRVLSATDMMRFNPSSLVGIYLFALGIRDMIEIARPASVKKARDASMCETRSHSNAVSADMRLLFNYLVPNNHIQGRAFNRCIWGVSAEMYEAHNKEDAFRRRENLGKSGYTYQASALLDEKDELRGASNRDRRDLGTPRDHERSSVRVTTTTGNSDPGSTSRKDETSRGKIGANSRIRTRHDIEDDSDDEYGDDEF